VAGQFGYSLASVDLNNDSLPDLVVGCPFFFQNDPVRGGAVYVYLNSEDGVQYAEPKRLLGPAGSLSQTPETLISMDTMNWLSVLRMTVLVQFSFFKALPVGSSSNPVK
jgi:hypothetical protein